MSLRQFWPSFLCNYTIPECKYKTDSFSNAAIISSERFVDGLAENVNAVID